MKEVLITNIIKIGDTIDDFECVSIREQDYGLIYKINDPTYGVLLTVQHLTPELILDKKVAFSYLRNILKETYHDYLARRKVQSC